MQIIRYNDLAKLDKHDLQKLGAQHAQLILDEGFEDATVLTVKARKALEYITHFLKGLDYETRLQITRDPEGWKDIYGAHLSLSSTGHKLGYQMDQKYIDLEKKLKDRKALLDLAFKSDDAIFDSEGVQVEKIKVKTQSKETLSVKI